MRTRRFVSSAGLLVVLACSPAGLPTPTPPPTPPTTPPAPAPTPQPQQRLHLSGRVLDQGGAPVADATVEVDYASAGGISVPPSTCPNSPQFCWLVTRTNDLGEYAVEFEPRPWPNRGLGYVYASRSGFEGDVQWVPASGAPAVRDMSLRPTRPIQAGESLGLTVGPTSSLCTDLEDLWVLDHRCEIVVIESAAGTLDVEARPMADGTVPSLFWYTSGNYAGFITRPAPGRISIPARGGTYRVLVAIPEGAASQPFSVSTTLRPAPDGRSPAVE